ncbi:MAG: T9SS type A sorting domain-containing protein [Bacteroidia bacterium]|nr:T9SS type A sorting domain-containing protein [Bacteroidia bacterium]
MKKNFILFVLLITGLVNLRAQVALYESFTAPFNASANGWEIVNLSSAVGTNTAGWIQGTSSSFSAIVGNATDYFAADMNSAASAGTTNTISCWLISPTLNLQSGAWLQFATRTATASPVRPERIQVYYSLGTGTNVGTTAGSATNTAGTFTNLILDVNPNMNNNYPTNWWLYTNTLTGISAPTVGRIAFRYYIPNGGPSGVNGNYVGIDEFRYSLPCNRPVFFGDPVSGAAVCVGQQVPFMIYQTSSTNPVNSYTWSNGATTSTTYIVPTATGVTAHATLGETTPGCQGLDISFYFADLPPTLSYTLNPGSQVCSGSTVSVNASGANTYSYLVGTAGTTLNPVILTAPTVTAGGISQFTLAGKSQMGCVSKQTITLHINPIPTLTASVSKTMICLNNTVNVSASGAATYSWAGANSSTLASFNYTGATSGVKQFTVYGVSALGCKSAESVVSLTVSTCTGINEEGLFSASAYPNPFINELKVSGFTGQVELYDVVGNLVLSARSEQSLNLNTSDLSKGLYLLKIKSDLGGENTVKLIKQ